MAPPPYFTTVYPCNDPLLAEFYPNDPTQWAQIDVQRRFNVERAHWVLLLHLVFGMFSFYSGCLMNDSIFFGIHSLPDRPLLWPWRIRHIYMSLQIGSAPAPGFSDVVDTVLRFGWKNAVS